jgi:hypothetical protein
VRLTSSRLFTNEMIAGTMNSTATAAAAAAMMIWLHAAATQLGLAPRRDVRVGEDDRREHVLEEVALRLDVAGGLLVLRGAEAERAPMFAEHAIHGAPSWVPLVK